MDVFTRRIIGSSVGRADIDGIVVCRMFNHAIARQPLPAQISTDQDPLFCFHRWLANLRVLEIDEVKTVPHVPVSHPFVERLIGTTRRELLDRTFFWNALDLKRKLQEFRGYYNGSRVHQSLDYGKSSSIQRPVGHDNKVGHDYECRIRSRRPIARHLPHYN